MEPDLALVIGVVLCVLAVPSILSAVIDRRAPRVAAVTLVAGGGLIVWAVVSNPGGYAPRDVPRAFVEVIARVIK